MTKIRVSILLLAALAASLLAAACARSAGGGPVRLGFLASEDEKWEEAARHWEGAVAREPRSVAARNNLAVAYEKLARWDDARREYEAALAIDPKNESVRYNFDRFLENMDEWKAPAGKAEPKGKDEKD